MCYLVLPICVGFTHWCMKNIYNVGTQAQSPLKITFSSCPLPLSTFPNLLTLVTFCKWTTEPSSRTNCFINLVNVKDAQRTSETKQHRCSRFCSRSASDKIARACVPREQGASWQCNTRCDIRCEGWIYMFQYAWSALLNQLITWMPSYFDFCAGAQPATVKICCGYNSISLK